MLKQPASGGRGSLVGPPYSRNPHGEAVVVRRAQLGTKPGHPLKEGNAQAWKDHLWSLAAALPAERRVLARRGWAGEMSSLFEHPAGLFLTVDTFQCWTYRHGLSEKCEEAVMRPIHHSLMSTIVPVLVVAGLMGLGFHSHAYAQEYPSDTTRGKAVYERHCQKCHGVGGGGWT